MKIKVLLNGIINYAAAVALAVVFALYMSGRVGWFITIAFICAPIISVLLTKLCMTRLSIECDNNFHALFLPCLNLQQSTACNLPYYTIK